MHLCTRHDLKIRIRHWHRRFERLRKIKDFGQDNWGITRIRSRTVGDVTVTFDSPVLFNPEVHHHVHSGPHLTLSCILSTVPHACLPSVISTFVYVPTESVHGIPSFVTPYNSHDHGPFRGSNGLPFRDLLPRRGNTFIPRLNLTLVDCYRKWTPTAKNDNSKNGRESLVKC